MLLDFKFNLHVITPYGPDKKSYSFSVQKSSCLIETCEPYIQYRIFNIHVKIFFNG